MTAGGRAEPPTLSVPSCADLWAYLRSHRVCHTHYLCMRTRITPIEGNQVKAWKWKSAYVTFTLKPVFTCSLSVIRFPRPTPGHIFCFLTRGFGFNYVGHEDSPLQVIIFPFIQLQKSSDSSILLKSWLCTDAFVKHLKNLSDFLEELWTSFLLIPNSN